jgi:AcrR family transcriptional regulator
MSRHEAVLDAAEKLFYERGFDGVGVDDIGRAAGVTGSAIYRHFDSKAEILAALFDRVIDALLMTSASPAGDPAAELHNLATQLAIQAHTHRQLAGIWEREYRSLSQPYKRRYHRRMRVYVDRWVDCLVKLYPGHRVSDMHSAVRGVHAMLLSDATRAQGPSRNGQATALLARMAVHSLEVLAEPRR